MTVLKRVVATIILCAGICGIAHGMSFGSPVAGFLGGACIGMFTYVVFP